MRSRTPVAGNLGDHLGFLPIMLAQAGNSTQVLLRALGYDVRGLGALKEKLGREPFQRGGSPEAGRDPAESSFPAISVRMPDVQASDFRCYSLTEPPEDGILS